MRAFILLVTLTLQVLAEGGPHAPPDPGFPIRPIVKARKPAVEGAAVTGPGRRKTGRHAKARHADRNTTLLTDRDTLGAVCMLDDRTLLSARNLSDMPYSTVFELRSESTRELAIT